MRLDTLVPSKPASFEALRSVVLADWTDAVMSHGGDGTARNLARRVSVAMGGERPATGQPGPDAAWPEGCVAVASMLRCGEAGLQGKLVIDGVGKRYSAALVKVCWLDGQYRVYTLTGAKPSVRRSFTSCAPQASRGSKRRFAHDPGSDNSGSPTARCRSAGPARMQGRRRTPLSIPFC